MKFDEEVKQATALFHAKVFLESINDGRITPYSPYSFVFDLKDGWEVENVSRIDPLICSFEIWNEGYGKELREAEKKFFNKFGKKVPQSFYDNDIYGVIEKIEDCISRGVIEDE